MNTSTVLLKKSEFFLRRHAPTIMTYVGIGGFVATVGLAIRATTKMDEISPKLREQIREAKETGEFADDVIKVTKKERKKAASEQLAKAYVEVAKEAAKIYGPTLAVGTVSILLVLGGHGMMVKRQAQMAALYTALDASYKAYRTRVREELGEEKEHDLYRRPAMRALDETEWDGEEGSDTTTIDLGSVLPSPYAKYFDPTSVNWVKEAEYNLMFLRAQEKWANDRLTGIGYLFLNEVYEALGLPRTDAGQIVGWKKQKNGGNDGYVSFGLGNIYDENARAFINGQENVALIDPNVDGIIKIEPNKKP